MKNSVVDIAKMSFSDVAFFLRAELAEYNVMTFEFISDNIDTDFLSLVSRLKGWYSAYIFQQSADDYFKVTFVTSVNPISFINRLRFLTNRKGGIQYV